MKNIIKKISLAKKALTSSVATYKPIYRVINIKQNEANAYDVVIQVIGKATTFTVKPETLLMDDAMVKLFSPIDVRNLTYLGYLGINTPKYKILAQKFSEEAEKTIFAVLKQGNKKYQSATAAELSTDKKIINGLTQKEAHKVGFIAGIEHMTQIRKKQILEK